MSEEDLSRACTAMEIRDHRETPRFLVDKPLDVRMYTPELVALYTCSREVTSIMMMGKLAAELIKFVGDFLELSSPDFERAEHTPLTKLMDPTAAGTGAGAHVSRLRCKEHTPAGYGGDKDMSGHACVPLAMLRAHPCRLRWRRERARMCPARYVQSAPPPATVGTGAGTHVSCSRCKERNPAGDDGGVSGHACVPLAMHRAHPRRLRRGGERARMCPARGAKSAPLPAFAGTWAGTHGSHPVCAERNPGPAMTDSDKRAAPASAEGWLRRWVGVAGPFTGSQSMRNPPEMTKRVSA